MVKAVMKMSWTLVCSVWSQCYPEVAVLVLSWSSCASNIQAADFYVFVSFHVCLHSTLLCQWYPVLQSWNGVICRLWCFHSCSIRLRQSDLYQFWHIRQLLDKTSFLHQTNNSYLLHVICCNMLLSRLGKPQAPPPGGHRIKSWW